MSRIRRCRHSFFCTDDTNCIETLFATVVLHLEYDRRFLFFFVGKFIPLEVTIDMLNGKKIVYQPDYLNLNSTLAKAFVNKFVLEVAFILFSYYQINHK